MMDSGTRRSNSPSGIKTTSNTTGTELGGRLSRLVLLSLRHQRAARQQPRLLAVLLSLQKSR